jgi:hypothetical protein
MIRNFGVVEIWKEAVRAFLGTNLTFTWRDLGVNREKHKSV